MTGDFLRLTLFIHLENNDSEFIWTEQEAFQAAQNYYWKAVAFVSRDELCESNREKSIELLIVYLLLIILSGWGAWVLARSINRRKLAEEKIHENLMKLQDLNATKDRFFSIIAHDLRSPFNTMLGFGEMLKEEVDNEKTEHLKEYTYYLYSGIQKTYNLLNGLLDWANLQRHKVAFEPKTIDVERCVDEIFQVLELSALNKKLTLAKFVPEKMELIADRNMFSTIVRNLLSNAIKFTPEGGTVTFIAKFSDGKSIFTVADTGIGIGPENFRKLFKVDESFSTAGTNKESGTGLGLVLCKELVERHGGVIWAESKKGKRSEISFYYPASLILTSHRFWIHLTLVFSVRLLFICNLVFHKIFPLRCFGYRDFYLINISVFALCLPLVVAHWGTVLRMLL